ncbi:MAG: ribonuclease Y [Planctomycetota bacterium]|nr:ribonuclease Y [Planctomycetota bacterium]
MYHFNILLPGLLTGSGRTLDLPPVLAMEISSAVVFGGGALLAIAAVATGVLISRVMGKGALAQERVEARRLVERAEQDARAEAERIRLEGEKAALERKTAAERELESARNELRETERRLTKREDAFDRKEEALNQKDQSLSRQLDSLRSKEGEVTKLREQLDKTLTEQREVLHKLSGMTAAQARDMLLDKIAEDTRHEMGKVARKIVEEAESEAKEKAREITLMAVQRYAGEHVSETTVRSVAIPSDDMKGRIIGREGRNIRAIERATGVDIIVDDTPGVIIVSCFDKVRQAIAVESLERLIADGRMHPSRIEEIVEKVRSEISERIMKYGKDASVEANLRGLHPKVMEAMGKLHYRTSYGQNVLRHSIEVGFLCQIIAEQLGLDGAIARRCGFLHDIGKAMDHEMEGGHPKIGMDFAKQFGEKEPVLNAIGGHHADIPSTSFYTPIVMAADAVSSARPGARRESMEKYVQRLNDLQDIALTFRGVTEAYAIQAGREVRVMIDAAKVDDDEAFLIAHQIAKKVSEEMTFPGEIRVTVLRETRAIEYAR